jgi:hypothetical protein
MAAGEEKRTIERENPNHRHANMQKKEVAKL